MRAIVCGDRCCSISGSDDYSDVMLLPLLPNRFSHENIDRIACGSRRDEWQSASGRESGLGRDARMREEKGKDFNAKSVCFSLAFSLDCQRKRV